MRDARPSRAHERLGPLGPLGGVILCAAALGVGGGFLARNLTAHRAAAAGPRLPAFHGQAVWSARARPAPDFVLRDQSGRLVSLGALRGRPVLLTFLDSRCKSSCPIEGRRLGAILRRLSPAEQPTLVVVSVDQPGDTPASIRRALTEWKLRGAWTTYWLNARARSTLAAVWRSYDVTVQPTSNDLVHSLALYLIDRRGDERTAYLFPFLPGFVQHDLARLARERT